MHSQLPSHSLHNKTCQVRIQSLIKLRWLLSIKRYVHKSITEYHVAPRLNDGIMQIMSIREPWKQMCRPPVSRHVITKFHQWDLRVENLKLGESLARHLCSYAKACGETTGVKTLRWGWDPTCMLRTPIQYSTHSDGWLEKARYTVYCTLLKWVNRLDGAT